MKAAIKRFIRDETGVEKVEYGIMLCLILIGAFTLARTLSVWVSTKLSILPASASAATP